MAKTGQKVITYAYKTMPAEQFKELIDPIHGHKIESDDFRDVLEADLTYLATFGLEDTIRAGVKESIQLIKGGSNDASDLSKKNKVNVRLVSGDHLETAKHVAVEASIITGEEAEEQGVCMTGAEYAEAIGEFEIKEDNQVMIVDQEQASEVNKKIRVLARANPEHKLLLVAGIKNAKGLVSMNGDSIADVPALRQANVGICMGSGCQVAKDNSDLVILDNDFVSIHRAIKWGRNIFDNVRKFLQFQLTINLTVCTFTLVSCATLGRSPLNIVQLLWTNLIMDILAAIALGTEPPKKDLSESNERISRNDRLMKPYIWRYVFGQSAYQLLVLLFFTYFGVFVFFTEEDRFNLIFDKGVDENLNPTNRLVLDTIVFNTFILMNLFNMILCKVGGLATPAAVVKSLFSNIFFWIVIAFEFAVQFQLVHLVNCEFLRVYVGTAELTLGMTITCWVLAALTIPVNIALRYVPLELFAFTDGHLDFEKEQRNLVTAWIDRGGDYYARSKSTFSSYHQA